MVSQHELLKVFSACFPGVEFKYRFRGWACSGDESFSGGARLPSLGRLIFLYIYVILYYIFTYIYIYIYDRKAGPKPDPQQQPGCTAEVPDVAAEGYSHTELGGISLRI